jgi:hypothetical protein
VAITPHTKDADDKLRKELEHADIGKFKRVLQKTFEKVLVPAKKPSKKK